MTCRAAARLGLYDRGLLRPGLKADLVLFDPDAVEDRATFTDPCQFPGGFEYVFVNGLPAWSGDRKQVSFRGVCCVKTVSKPGGV
ncbi:hypothetical protein N752_25510 [Desulforamulus aquiferis]|nr:hypothetical protein N752_25510 [Desulforamulus aquiferis]